MINIFETIPENLKPFFFQTTGERGELPLGVKENRIGKARYKVVIPKPKGKVEVIAKVDDPMEGHRAWQITIANRISEGLDQWKGSEDFNSDIAMWLVGRAEQLLEDYELGIETV